MNYHIVFFLLGEWKSILTELSTLTNLKVHRCYFYTEPSHVNFQLHGFCDASVQAYTAVVYLQTVYADDSVTVRLIASKTRVSPVKSQTIPRLELLAAVILTRLVIVVRVLANAGRHGLTLLDGFQGCAVVDL